MRGGRLFLAAFARSLVLWCALLPFAALMLVAPGVMPARGVQGIELVLCTDTGAQTVHLPDEAPAPDCPWALLAQPFMSPGPAPFDPPPRTLRPVAVVPALPAPLRRAEVLAPSARGPPLL